jgi:hypothetical protein
VHPWLRTLQPYFWAVREGACQYWPGKTGSEKISVLVNGIALDATENKFLKELLLKVIDHHALGTESQSLLLDGVPVLVLADVAEISNHGVALINKIPEYDGCV